MKPILEVLIVEDDRATRKLLSYHVKSLGYHADFAVDGNEALVLWKGHDYDLILTDCSMPGISGPEFAATVRSARRTWKRTIPIIAMTGYADEAVRTCLAAGIDDVIAKPFAKAELQRVLCRWARPRARTISEGSGAISPPDSGSQEDAQDRMVMRSVTVTFIATVTEYLEAISNALHSGCRSEIAAAAHQLKSPARLVGGLEVAELCERLERAAADGRDTEIRKLGATIPGALKALKGALRSDLSR